MVTTEVQVSILVYCKSEVGKGSGEWLGEGLGVIVMLGYVIFRQMDHCIRGEQWRDIAYMFIYQNHYKYRRKSKGRRRCLGDKIH